MKKILGLAVIALGVFLEVMWLGVCFGTVIIGIILLIFAPRILFFPFNFFLVIGLTIMAGGEKIESAQFRFRQSSSQQGFNNFNNFTNTSNSLDEHYKTLESNPTDSFDTIKKNYRRLVKEYHYDSIASKDLPESMINLAKEKTQKLNEAYSAIKEVRG